MITGRNAIVAIVVILTAACSGKLVVREISNTESPGAPVNGIPFRMAKQFTAELYEKNGKKYKPVDRQAITLPDPYRLYLLSFQADPLANPSFDVIFNPDNTIQQVSLKSESKGAGALDALTAQVTALTAAQTARETASKAAVTAASSASIAADKAKQAADVAALEYQLLKANPSVPALDLLKAEQKERSAKLDANETARLAGKAPYFPGVVP